jgi:hypothetical protein
MRGIVWPHGWHWIFILVGPFDGIRVTASRVSTDKHTGGPCHHRRGFCCILLYPELPRQSKLLNEQ